MTPDNAAADPQEIIADLQRRLDESFAQQAATAEVLAVINSSASDLAPVLDAMLDKAMRLCDAAFGLLSTYDGNQFQSIAMSGVPAAFAEFRRQTPLTYGQGTGPARVLAGERVVHILDLKAEDAYREGEPNRRAIVDLAGARTVLLVPLLRNDAVRGLITIYRQEARLFSDEQVALLQNFAVQAAIAIENARLFNETKEALERQTATAEILKVIASSPNDVQPVFEAIAESAKHLMGGQSGIVTRVVGDQIQLVAFTKRSEAGDRELQSSYPIALTSPLIQSTVARTGEYIVRTDIEAEPSSTVKELAQSRGYRSTITVPMLREGISIGTIGVARHEAGSFTKSQIDLLKTFADQAVIAIENARLFNEVQAKTRDLTEALTYQTGSSNILKVIASSPTDVQPVLKAIVESACELCEAYDAIVHLREGDDLRHRAHHGPIPVGFEKQPISRNRPSGRSIIDKVSIHVHDILSAEGDEFPDAQRLSRRQGLRTILSVPLLRENESIGVILLRRTEMNPFSDKQIALLQTFADQAVIAIGNVRLFDEVQARTRDLMESLQFQTATSDVLKVISRSPDALQPVLDVIVDTSRELCGSDASTIFLLRDGMFHVTAVSGDVPSHMAFLQANPLPLDQPGSALPRMAR